MGRRNELLLTVLLATVAVVLVIRPRTSRVEKLPDQTETAETQGRVTDLPDRVTLSDWYAIGHLLGPESAPVQILEFGTFTCTFCRTLAASIDTVQRRYPGLISLRWIHYLPTGGARNTTYFMADASECVATLSRFELFYRLVLLDSRILDSRGAVVAASRELGIAEPAGLLACMDAQSNRNQLMRHSRATSAIGDTGTPAWFLNGRLFVGSVSSRQLDSLVKLEFRGR